MKAFTACFSALIVSFVAMTTCVIAGNSADGTQSVLIGQPTLADEPIILAPCVEQPTACANGRCARKYNEEVGQTESCRNRLFGGTVVKKSTRTVYRPVRR